MKKKGITSLALGVIAVAAVAMLYFSGGVTAIYAMITGPKPCSIAPTEFNCLCAEGYDKVRGSAGPYSMGWLYSCEPSINPSPYSFPMDPNDPDFAGMAVAFAEEYLSENFPGCDTNCDPPMLKDIYSSTPGPYGYVECLNPTDPSTFDASWRVVFSLQDGSIHPLFGADCNIV